MTPTTFRAMPITITCAVCNKPVDKLSWFDDINAYARRITAYCHGDTDTMVLKDGFVMEAGGRGQLTHGVAFQTKEITNDTRPNQAVAVSSTEWPDTNQDQETKASDA
jgi:hypothetical protein